MTTTPALPASPRRRPRVLDATRSAVIPLRPLTIGEVLDAAFLVMRSNPRIMVGVPVAVAAAASVYSVLVVGLWQLLGNTSGQFAQVALTILAVVLGLLLMSLVVAWLTAVLTRVTLHTALGEGFAPSAGWTWRQARRLFWPMVGLSLLQSIAGNIVQSAVSILYYVGILGITLAGGSDLGLGIATLVWSLIALALYSAAYSYLALTVPAWSVETEGMPGWIGKPARTTNIVTAFGRSAQLIGLRNLGRSTVIVLMTFLLCGIVAAALWVGTALIVLVYSDTIGIDLGSLITDPKVLGGSYAVILVISVCAMVMFTATVQTVLYLDLRMRREGLDLALRFDEVEVPQPVRPPRAVWMPMMSPPPGVRR